MIPIALAGLAVFPERHHRPGHDGAGAAAHGQGRHRRRHRLPRRVFGRDRHGHRRFRRGRGDDLEPSRHAHRPAAARLRGHRSRRLRDRRAAGLHRSRDPARLCLLPRIRRSGARRHRPAVLRRHRAGRAGFPRRAHLVARHGARRQRRARRRLSHLGLHAPSPEPRLGRRVLVRRGRHRPLRHHGAQAHIPVRRRPAAAHARRRLEPDAQHPVLRRLLPLAPGDGDGADPGQSSSWARPPPP